MIIYPNNCYNMDCAEGMLLMKEQGLKADWCITDPPYGINIADISYTKGVGSLGNSKAQRKDYSKCFNFDTQNIGGVL